MYIVRFENGKKHSAWNTKQEALKQKDNTMYNNLIIRVDKVKDLILLRNRERVYFIFRFGQSIFNGLDYDLVSDEFNKILNS